MKTDSNIFILMNDFSEKLIGVQVSAIQRSKIFYEFITKNIEIVTTKFNKNIIQFSQLHMRRYALHDNINSKNLYVDILGMKDWNSGKTDIGKMFNHYYSEKISDFHEKYYDPQNNLKMYIVYSNKNETSEINYINHFNNKKKAKRDHFLSNSLILSQYLTHDGKIKREEYFDNNGISRIIKEYEDNKISIIYLNNKYGIIEKTFPNESELIAWWLVNFVIKKNSIFIVDGGPHHIIPLKLINNIKVISVLHSNHIRSGEDPLTGNFNSSERKNLLATPNSVNACVILTDEQKQDIENRLDSHCLLYTIPHPNLNLTPNKNLDSRDYDKLIIISRLEKEKNITEAIDIMQLVISKHPRKKLYIYGDGSEKDMLRNLISEKKLDDSIFLMGYTSDISKELNDATLFLMTSLYESFGLSISESLSHGVPVLSYDFKYGPGTLIKNDENGFLIENRNINLAANTIIQYYNDLERIRIMIDNAYESVNWLSGENISKLWVNLFKKIQ